MCRKIGLSQEGAPNCWGSSRKEQESKIKLCDKLATVIGRQFIILSVHLCLQHIMGVTQHVTRVCLRQLRLIIISGT